MCSARSHALIETLQLYAQPLLLANDAFDGLFACLYKLFALTQQAGAPRFSVPGLFCRRLLLSQPLRSHAGLDKKIMLVGQLNKFELWDEARWQQQINDDILGLPEDDWASSPRLQDFSL